MNKKALIAIGVVVLLGAGILWWQSARQQTSFAQAVAAAQNSSEPALVGVVNATITNYAFEPQIIKIKVGSTIMWTNEDNAPHTVTSDTGTYLDSPVLNPGAAFEKTFDTPGVYRYHCTPHPQMLGAVIVET